MASVVDLFAGAGGLSLGAARAGFNVAAAVELDSHAISSHKVNLSHCGCLHNRIEHIRIKQ